MKYLSLVFAGLRRKPARTVLTFLSIVVAFLLFGVLSTVESNFNRVFELRRLDRLNVSARFGRFADPLPAAYGARIARVAGVRTVSPQAGMGGFWKTPRNNFAINFVTPAHLAAYPELTITTTQMQQLETNRTGLIVSAAVARQRGWKVGDRIPVNGQTVQRNGSRVWIFDIIAIADNRDLPGEDVFVLGSYRYFDEARATGAGTVGSYVVRIADEKRSVQTARAIDALFLNSPQPTVSYSERGGGPGNRMSPDDVTFFVRAIVGGVLFLILFITGNTMMQSMRERVPEFAILKTIGFSDGGVLALVLAEAALLCVTAGLAGLGLSNLLARVLATAAPGIPKSLMQMPLSAALTGLFFALLTTLLSSLIPAIRMKRLKVVDALAGR